MRSKLRHAVALPAAIVLALCAIKMMRLSVDIRFSSPQNDYLLVMVLCVLLPLSVSILAFIYTPLRSRLLSSLIGLPLLLPCGLIYLFSSWDYYSILEKGRDLSFELIQEVTTDNRFYRLYRTNGGATTSYGLVLRAESGAVLGFKAVEVLYSKYQASEARIELVSPNELQVTVAPYGKEDVTEQFVLAI